MPSADQITDDLDPIKLLLLGDSKAGKTHYLLDAANAGFHVFVADGDIAARTLRKMVKAGELSQAAAKRIKYLKIADYVNEKGAMVPFMAEFFVAFTTSGMFLWNDTLGRPFDPKTYLHGEGGHVVWEIYPSRMGPETLLLLDSWTALIQSVLQWKADALGEDLGEIEKVSRDMYAGSGHKATQFLQLLRATRCHLGVIGHPREYVKLEKPKGKVGSIQEKDMKIEWTKMIPVSTSNPHAMTMAKNFTDVAWIQVTPTGNREIDMRASDAKVIGGSLNIKGSTSEYNFKKLVELSGGTVDPNSTIDHWFTEYPAGEYQIPVKASPLGSKAGSAPSQVQTATRVPTGLGALAALKKQPNG